MMTLLFFGDVVGEPGRLALYRLLPELRQEFAADAVIVNGENAAGGRGITPRLAREFLEQGVDVITLGDHAWDQAELIPWLREESRVLRPFNLQVGAPGEGSVLIETRAGRLGVLCLEGRTFMKPGPENPFTRGKAEAQRLRAEGAAALLVDFHAEATSEKIALGYHLDGVASAVLGTHTHVQTADARLLPGGTAFMCDVGMCGSRDGIIGREAAPALEGYISSMPCKLPVGGWPALLCGVAVQVNPIDGRAVAVHPFQRLCNK